MIIRTVDYQNAPPEFEGVLRPVSEQEVEDWKASLKNAGARSGLFEISEEDLPVIGIGKPETWLLQDFLPSNEIDPALLSKMLSRNDFYVIRLSCSFLPRLEQIAIEWARYEIFFYQNNDSEFTVYDLIPMSVTQPVTHKTMFKISPKLSFMQVEADIGSASHGIEYNEMYPIIYGAGAGEEVASWTFQGYKSTPIQGGKFMFVLLKTPKGVEPRFASVTMNANIKAYGALLRAKMAFRDENMQTSKILKLMD